MTEHLEITTWKTGHILVKSKKHDYEIFLELVEQDDLLNYLLLTRRKVRP